MATRIFHTHSQRVDRRRFLVSERPRAVEFPLPASKWRLLDPRWSA